MKDESSKWLAFAMENVESAEILLKSHLYNPCLQNIQQAVEKSMKSILIENDEGLLKTHDILELRDRLSDLSIEIDIDLDECNFLNSIYLPSKYPLGSVIPDFDPDEELCQDALKIAIKVTQEISILLNKV